MMPRDGACMDTRGTVGRICSRIYKEDHFTLLHTKYESFRPCGFGEEDFFKSFSHDAPGAGPVWTSGARLAGFIKRTTIHCYKQNMKALALVVSSEKFEVFLCFTHDPPPPPPPCGAGSVLTPGARLAGFIKRTTIHCYKQNMKALGLVVSEKNFLCFTHDPPPRAGPVWIPGALLAGFIKRTTIHCY